jgi:hypothetical protein
MGEIGKLFYDDIKKIEALEVISFVDKMADNYMDGYDNLPVKTIEKYTEKNIGETLIVTPVFYMNQITEELIESGVEPERILSLNQLFCDI